MGTNAFIGHNVPICIVEMFNTHKHTHTNSDSDFVLRVYKSRKNIYYQMQIDLCHMQTLLLKWMVQ